jgi:hypothetical protein
VLVRRARISAPSSITKSSVIVRAGRILAASGTGAKAKRAYDDVFALWKDADPDIPVFKQAKAEYAKLK